MRFNKARCQILHLGHKCATGLRKSGGKGLWECWLADGWTWKRLSHHPWRYLKDGKMGCFGTWVSGGPGSSEFTIVLDPLKRSLATLMILWFYDSSGEVRMCFIRTDRSFLGNRKYNQNVPPLCQATAALRPDWLSCLETWHKKTSNISAGGIYQTE